MPIYIFLGSEDKKKSIQISFTGKFEPHFLDMEITAAI